MKLGYVRCTAKDRLDRAHRTNIRGAMQLGEYKPQEKVDIWFEPTTKDQCGWRGPAEVLSANTSEGNYSVRIQGRTLIRRPQEVRPHIPYFTYLTLVFAEFGSYWQKVKEYAEGIKAGVMITLGVVMTKKGWQLTKISRTQEGEEILQNLGKFIKYNKNLLQLDLSQLDQ